MKEKILVVDDEESLRLFLKATLSKTGYDVLTAANAEEALTLVARTHFPLVLTDLRMPGKDGMELLEEIKARYPETEVIIITAYGSIEKAVEAIKAGAADFLVKPLPDPEYVRTVVDKIFQQINSRKKELYFNGILPQQTFIAEDEKSRAVLQMLELVAHSDATVLLTGESGTGKEVAARTIHNLSIRKNNAFVIVNCAALPENLIESELFGYEKGAFTGANSPKPGKFTLADKGTLFLDEIGELPLSLQAKLLRVLQEKSFEPLGSIRSRTVDIRVIAATNKDLAEEVRKGNFREDLYYRLNVFPIELPPLRQRQSDILPLAKHFLAAKNVSLSKEAEALLLNYNYPGNVRELQNILERAVILAQGNVIAPKHLLFPAQGHFSQANSIEEAKKEAIIQALTVSKGHRAKAAKILGISLRTLQYKIKKYAITADMQKLHK